jgi:hypothetical protein
MTEASSVLNPDFLRLVFDADMVPFRVENVLKALRTGQCAQIRKAMPQVTVLEVAQQAIRVFERGTGDGFNAKYQIANISMIDPSPDAYSYPLFASLRASKVRDIVAGYLGDAIYCLLPISYLRKVAPARRDIAIPYHQDGLGLPDGEDYRMLSIWMLLAPLRCGSTAPGLEFMVGAPARMLKFEDAPENENFRNTQTADREIEELEQAGAQRWVPENSIGDVMLFNQWCPHRAYISGAVARYSFETRLVAATPAAKALFEQRGTAVLEF